MFIFTKIYFFLKYINFLFENNLNKKSFILCFFITFHYHSVGYAMEKTNDVEGQESAGRVVVKNKGENLKTFTQEEAEIIPLLPTTKERSKSWKQNWVVKDIVAELPIIGDFFHEDLSITDSLKRAGKSTAMLVGGSVGMMLEPIPMSMSMSMSMSNDNMATHITKTALNMAIGMWIAASAYNTVLSLGNFAYQCCSTPHQSSQGTYPLPE